VERVCWCGGKRAILKAMLPTELGEEFPLVRCAKCGVFALHPMPTPENLGRYYSGEYYGKSRQKFIGPMARAVSWFQSERARYITRFLSPGGPHRILDIGCGNGGLLRALQKMGHYVEGTEWTAESAARVPAQFGIPVHVGDLVDIDLPAESYDAVILWHVFEHLARPAETLEKVHRLLKKRGRVFIALPNHESWQAQRFGPNWFHLDPPRHLHGFGVHSLLTLLALKEFRWIQTQTNSFEQNPYGFLQSLLNSMGYPRDQAYGVLKGTAKVSFGTKLRDLALVGALAPIAIATDVIESAVDAGATLTVVACRTDDHRVAKRPPS
jgi:SAM-dependent methyltransferase